jgi:microcystin-dependent protein
MPVWKWSKTASSNATADSTINWAEGMAPSAVNDSARAEMAAVAKWRDDISGTITTGGSSTAYTVATNSVYDTLAHLDGAMIAFVPHATSGATVTLSVDGLGAQPLRSAPSTELPAGVLVQGTPYVATYYNATAEFILQGFTGNPYNVPIGGGMPFFLPTAPNSSFVFPFGQAISRTTYSVLLASMSTTFGAGDGSTTFNLPDLRGRVLAGKDDMGGSAASRLTATYFGTSAAALGAVGGGESHALTTAEMPAHSHGVTDSGHTHGGANTIPGSDTSATIGGINVSGSRIATIPTATTGISIDNAGGGGAHAIVQPTIIVNYILRII